jgi:hypothetical protein
MDNASPLFLRRRKRGFRGQRGSYCLFNDSLETVGEFYAMGGEEGVGSDATPFTPF